MTATAPPLTWILGRGGLLGQHVEHALVGRGTLWTPPRVPWGEPAAVDLLRDQAREFARAAAGGPWQLVWAAGAGVTGTSREVLAEELRTLAGLLEALGEHASGGSGAALLASSAGAVYSGVGAPPYDETSPVRPLAPYGEAKLEAEDMFARWATTTGTPVVSARIANLYGPGQNLAKAQGLISQLCRAHLTARPLSIYVSLDTLRDYVFAPDCAAMVLDCLDLLRAERALSTAPVVRTKVLASQRAVTIGALLGEMRRLFKRPPKIVVGSSPSSAFQARDLRLRSVVWPEVSRRARTPLGVGIHATSLDLSRRLQLGAIR